MLACMAELSGIYAARLGVSGRGIVEQSGGHDGAWEEACLSRAH